MDSTGGALSRQVTLPEEDPAWLYPRIPEQPAPIPPRNEPLLYIPSNTVDDSDMLVTTSCLKNLQVKVHFPSKFTASTRASNAHAGTETPFGSKSLGNFKLDSDDALLSSTMASLIINSDASDSLQKNRYESLIKFKHKH
jgi:hypothetical protein